MRVQGGSRSSESLSAEYQIGINRIDFVMGLRRDYLNKLFSIFITTSFGLAFALSILIIISAFQIEVGMFENLISSEDLFNALVLNLALYMIMTLFIAFYIGSLYRLSLLYGSWVDDYIENYIHK